MNQLSRCYPPSHFRAVLVLVVAFLMSAAVAGEAVVRPTTRPWLDMPQAPPTPTGALTPTIAFPHLTFQGPVTMILAPRSNRFYVCEREGRIWSFENDPSTTTKTLVLDLSAQCQGLDDCGLMGLAFHPDFGLSTSANRGKFFVYYEYTDQTPLQGDAPVYRPNKAGQYTQMSTHLWNRLSSFTIADGAVVASPTETVLINQRDRHPWHGGGGMFFHPVDGFLWLVIGDEGNAGDSPYDRTQRLNAGLFSGVLRIDVDGPRTGISHTIPRKPDLGDATTTTANYGIPNDNPFVGVPGVLEEFWAVGLRSPHRMTYDPVSGMVLIGDIGQNSREEISLVVKGGNYQWVYREGHVGSGAGPSYQINQAGGHAAGTTVLSIDTNGNSRGGTLLDERVVFAGVTGTYTVTAVAGAFPHTQITITPQLAGPVANDALITRTTGLTLTSALTAGTTVLPVTGTGMALAPRDCVRIEGLAETYRVTSTSAGTVTIAPGLSGATTIGARIDLNPVIGREQAPVIEFDRTNFSAIIGGYIYRGTRHPDLYGKYIFGDNPRGVIWSIDPTQYPTTATAISNLNLIGPYDGGDSGYRGLSGFAVDADGELYLLRMQYRANSGDALPSTLATTGRILTLERVAAPTDPVIPTQLSLTGAFDSNGSGAANWPLVPTTDLIPYDVNSPLWSDGAHKSRWIALPNPTGKTAGFDPASEQIAFATTGEWTFPAGTVFVKHFELTVNEQTGVRKRLETRLLLRKPAPAGGVYGVTYRWRADNSDADLIDDAESEAITVTLADGVSTRVQTWNYPGRSDCLSCHNDNAHWVLGVKTRQQNGPCSDPAFPTTNQLRTWSAIGMFDNPPLEADLPNLASTVPIGHPSATIENQSRSWLDANCSHCHRPGGVQAFFDARYDTALSLQRIVEGDVGIDLGVTNARVIARGSISRSILHVRDSSLTAGIKMPPLAKNRVDDPAMAVISAWISSLGATQSVAITSPISGDALGLPGPFTITADTGASTWVNKVEFKVDGVLVGTDTSAPYSIAWTPTVTDSYQLTATVTDNAGTSTTSAAVTVTTVKSPATVTFTTGILAQTYNALGKTVTATTTPTSLPVVYGYPGGSPPVNAGSHTVSATIDHPHYHGTITDQLVISKATATVTLANLTPTYDGTAKSATATTTPAGRTVTFSYNGSATAPTAAGTYVVVGTISDANYQGSATDNLVIGKATATITLGSLTPTYDGTPKSATATTTPTGRTVTFTYDGSAIAPTAAGTYAVIATISDTNYQGSTTGNLEIGKATATITLGSLTPTYDGSPKSATATTNPAGRTVTFTYAGSAIAPTNVGSYALIGTISDANYQGQATDTFVIGQAVATVTLQHLTQTFDGSPKAATVVTTPTGLTTVVTYDGGATVPSALGTYAVVATVNEANYSGSANGTLTITSQPVLSVAAVAAPEGNSGTSNGTLTAVLSTTSTSTITVAWAASAGTADTADFTVVSGTLTFAPGDLSKAFDIPISGDTAFEADETVIVTFSDPQLVALDATTAVLTITNDDANTAPVIAEGSAASVTCDEDNAPTLFALTLHASDIDAGQVLTWSIITAPSHGSLAPLASGPTQTISYLPSANFSGADSLTVEVADGFGGAATCVVSVTVTPRNDPPALTAPPVVTLAATATATEGTWSDAADTTPGTITTALQWQRADDALGTNLIDLAGETTTSHTLTAADLGKYLRVRVTASDDGEGLPAVATTVAYADFVMVPSGSSGSGGGAGSSGGGGGGCGLGGSVASLLALALLMLRRQRFS